MHVRCPHCHHGIEIVGDHELADINCPSCGSKFNLVPETESWTPSPQWLNHFELLDRLGTGAFGTVWKARDTKLDRLVAVKIPRRSLVNPAEAESFLREARAAAQLRHPQIVAVHEVGLQESGDLYIVSDLVQGVTLADHLAVSRLGPREAAQLCARIADALHHAHEAGVIHRDLKPSNIMLDGDGLPHVMDFGLAKREAGEITMTVDGKVLGTPAYMSPEQARGEGHYVDRRTDVYSLGVILFELLSGERPFRGSTQMLLHQVIHDEPPSPRKLNRRVARDLETICLKCLEKDPLARYATADALADDLRKWINGQPVSARPTNTLRRFWKWYSQRKSTVAGAIAVFSCSLAGTNVLALSIYNLFRRWDFLEFLVLLSVGLVLPLIGVGSGIAAMRSSRLGLIGAFAVMTLFAFNAAFILSNELRVMAAANPPRQMPDPLSEVQYLSILSTYAAWFLVGSLVQIHALWYKIENERSG